MKKILLAVLVACCASASAKVVDFENIPAGLTPVPDGYGGLNWNNHAELDVFSQADVTAGTLPAGYANGIHSGTQATFNVAGESPVVITLAAPGSFNFNSGYFTASSGSETLNFIGLLGGNTVFTSGNFVINDSGPQLIAPGSDSVPIDTLEIFSSVPGSEDNAPQWILDDFAYTLGTGGGGGDGGGDGGGGGTVPEPFSLSLVGLGLAALGATRRRKR